MGGDVLVRLSSRRAGTRRRAHIHGTWHARASLGHATLPSVLLIVSGVAFAFGWPTRNGAFLSGDDQRLVTDHVLVNHPTLDHAWKLLTIVHGDLYQPLPMLSFQADYAMASVVPALRFGVSAYGFHLTNIFLHTLNAGLVCLVALRISRRHSVAFLTGVMFACHPFAMEPIAWVSGRMILMATTFALLTILICLHRRPDGRGYGPWWAGLVWSFSLLSKVLPSVPIAAAWCDYSRNGLLPRRTWLVYAVLMAMGLGAGMQALRATDTAGFRQAAEAEATTSIPVRLLLATGYYLENYVWPNRLSAWSPPAENETITSPDTLRALFLMAVFVSLAGFTRKRDRTIHTGLMLFAILLAPFLYASLSRRMLAADRYMYLPMLGLHLAAAAATVRAFDFLRGSIKNSHRADPEDRDVENVHDRIRDRSLTVAALTKVPLPIHPPSRGQSAVMGRSVVAVAAAAVLAIWFGIGRSLAPTWADTISRDQRVLAVYPDDVLAHCELARAFVFTHEPDNAIEIVEQARVRWPQHPRLAAQAGEAWRLKGNWRQAEAELAFAAARMPGHTRTVYYHALTLEKVGRREEARRLYRRILVQNTEYLPAAAALARSFTAAGEIDAAMAAWETALEISPFHRDSLYELALLKIQRKNIRSAERLLKRILELDAADRPARFHLAVVLFNSGRGAAAVELYRRLLSEDETDVVVRLNLAHVLAAVNPADPAAEREYRRILKQRPDSLPAALGLHELLYPRRRIDATSILELWTGYHRAAGETAESAGYLAWAQMLGHRIDEARSTVSSIPADSVYRPFADWVFVYDALRRQAWDDLADWLEGVEIDWTGLHTVKRQQQARVIRYALLELPESIRQSAAGRYVLARFFLFEQNRDRARQTAEQIVAEAESNRWTAAARALLTKLNTHNSNAD